MTRWKTTAALAIGLGLGRHLLRHQRLQKPTDYLAVDDDTPDPGEPINNLGAFDEALQNYRRTTFRNLREVSLMGLVLYLASLLLTNSPFFFPQRLEPQGPLDWSSGLEPEIAVGCVSGSVTLVFMVVIAVATTPAPPTTGVQEMVNWSMWRSVLYGVALITAAFGVASALTQFANDFALGLALLVFACLGLIVTSALRARRDDVVLHASRELEILRLRAAIKRVRDHHPYATSHSSRRQFLGWLSILGWPVILPTSVYVAAALATDLQPGNALALNTFLWFVVLLFLTAITVMGILKGWYDWARYGRPRFGPILLVVVALFVVLSLLLVFSALRSHAATASLALLVTWFVVLAYQQLRGTSRSLLVSRTLATATHRTLLRDLGHARRAEHPFFPPPQRSCSTSSIRGRADSSP